MSGKSFTRNEIFPVKYSRVHHKSIKDRTLPSSYTRD